MLKKQDAELVDRAVDSFSKNVIATYEGDALAEFSKAVKPLEYPRIIITKLSRNFNRSASPEKRISTTARYCTSVLPAMKRAFGEEFLVRALPKEARNQKMVDICEEVGAKELANLFRKGMSPK